MITNLFWFDLDDMDIIDIWYKQDGAAFHKAHVTLDILQKRFEKIVFIRGGGDNQCHWPNSFIPYYCPGITTYHNNY